MGDVINYQGNFSRSMLIDYLKKFWHKIGLPLVYRALLLFFVLQDPRVPAKAKAIIIGALAYLISPMDGVPDCLPGGFVDDAALIAGALVTISCYIDEGIKQRAKDTMTLIFGENCGDCLENT